MKTFWRRVNALPLPQRLLLAALPSLLPTLADWLTDWIFSCFFNNAWYCIYDFHPPFMDLLFAGFVLLPFLPPGRWWAGRAGLLVVLSVIVHATAVESLVGFRGSLAIPWIDSIFVNIFPVAILASVVVSSATAWICRRRIRTRLWWLSAFAGSLVGFVFLLTDITDYYPTTVVMQFLATPWWTWHLGVCAAIYLGSEAESPKEA
jgi:hypothetical protein